MSNCDLDDTFGPSAASCRGGLDFTLLFEESIFTIAPTTCLFAVALLELFWWPDAQSKVRKHWTGPAKMVRTFLGPPPLRLRTYFPSHLVMHGTV